MRRSVPFALVALLGGCGDPGDAPDVSSGFDASHTPDVGALDVGPLLDAPPVDTFVPTSPVVDWEDRVLYLAMPDRFFDGDPKNNDAGEPGCFDKSKPLLFHGGDLAGVAQKIGYLQELGVSALWVTPLAKQTPLRAGSCGYHGYWMDLTDPDDGAMEPKMGTLAEATALREGLHAAGIKLVLDMVVNHPGRNARIVTEHPDWFHSPDTCASLGPTDIYCSLSGLPDFAQEKTAVASYLDAMSRDWVKRLAPDGIRMDTAKHVQLSYFAERWSPAVRAASAVPLFIVAEFLDEGPFTRLAPLFASGFDSAFNFPLRRALVDSIAKGGSLDRVAQSMTDAVSTLGIARVRKLSTLLDNHDVPRFLAEAPSSTSKPELERRNHIALASLYTLPGIPQLYYGDELGMIGVFPDNRRDMPSFAWDAATRVGEHEGYVGDVGATFALVKKLAKLRETHLALRRGSYTELWRPNGGTNVLAFHRGSSATGAAIEPVLVVISGVDSAATPISLNALAGGIDAKDRAVWPEGTKLVDVLADGAPASLTVTGGRIRVELSKKAVGIYVASKP